MAFVAGDQIRSQLFNLDANGFTLVPVSPVPWRHGFGIVEARPLWPRESPFQDLEQVENPRRTQVAALNKWTSTANPSINRVGGHLEEFGDLGFIRQPGSVRGDLGYISHGLDLGTTNNP